MQYDIKSMFANYQVKKDLLNERQHLLKEMLVIINEERVGTKFKAMTGRVLAIKLGHIPTEHMYYIISVGKDCKNRGGSFSKYLFGSIKTHEKNTTTKS